MSKTCWACEGEGTDTWCMNCTTTQVIEPIVIDDADNYWMQTYSGLALDPLHPMPNAMRIIDAARGLSREHRYGKQAIFDYTVAEHCIVVSSLAGMVAEGLGLPDVTVLALEREGLLHDIDEGWLPDMPRPIKHRPEMSMDMFRLAGSRLRQCAYDKYGVMSTQQSAELIDTIDKRLVLDEVAQVMRAPTMFARRHADRKPTGVKLQCLTSERAFQSFLFRFEQLFPDVTE